jgi:BASS family bile acid:Na+ symporter
MIMSFFKKQAFGVAILACAAAAFAWPGAFKAWGGVKLVTLVVPAIQLIMFGMGTTLSLSDFLSVVRAPWAVCVGVALQFAVMPLVGWGVASAFGFDGELAAGCVLVGSVAGGTASNVVAYLAKANVALSVTMTCCSTLLSPFVTPLLVKLLAGRFVDIDAVKLMVESMKIVLVPVVAGGLVRCAFRSVFEKRSAECGRVLTVLSMSGICFTILALTAAGRDTLRDAGAAIVAAAVLHNAAGFVAGYWLTRLLGRVLPFGESEARTVAIEVGMQNSGMAAALSIGVLGSAVAALPANVFSIWMNFSGSVLASIWSRSAKKD